eukprot:6191241-Pleurochrysis_carterae.AAC.6
MTKAARVHACKTVCATPLHEVWPQLSLSFSPLSFYNPNAVLLMFSMMYATPILYLRETSMCMLSHVSVGSPRAKPNIRAVDCQRTERAPRAVSRN